MSASTIYMRKKCFSRPILSLNRSNLIKTEVGYYPSFHLHISNIWSNILITGNVDFFFNGGTRQPQCLVPALPKDITQTNFLTLPMDSKFPPSFSQSWIAGNLELYEENLGFIVSISSHIYSSHDSRPERFSSHWQSKNFYHF